jgi:hypothetical protein
MVGAMAGGRPLTGEQIAEVQEHLTGLAQRTSEQRLPPDAAWAEVDTAAKAFVARFPRGALRWLTRGTSGRMEDRDGVVLAIDMDWGIVRIPSTRGPSAGQHPIADAPA